MTGAGVIWLVVDSANVVGSVPDGWWRDRVGATARLRDGLLALGRDDLGALLDGVGVVDGVELVLVVEGAARGVDDAERITIVRAPGSGDDALVEVVKGAREQGARVVVATADRGLIGRVEALGADVIGPRRVRGPENRSVRGAGPAVTGPNPHDRRW